MPRSATTSTARTRPINALEREVAELLGHEAGLFVPSGSMGNQLGLRLHAGAGRRDRVRRAGAHRARRTRRGRRVLGNHVPHVAQRSRRHRRRVDPRADLAGRRPVPGVDRRRSRSRTRTTSAAAPCSRPSSSPRSPSSPASIGSPLHLDGARLWNAHVATGTSLHDLAAPFDTVSVCLSKGLGAPVGSVLVSSADRIREARVWRKRYGGRHAAGGHPRRGRTLRAEPSRRASRRRPRARGAAGRGARRRADADEHRRAARRECRRPSRQRPREAGVLVSALGPQFLRLVTHLDIDDAGVDRAIEVLAPLLDRL